MAAARSTRQSPETSMPLEFSRSMRSLDRDGAGQTLVTLACGLVILALWLIWFLRADIGRYEVADTARLESDSAGYDLQAPVAGRVVASRLVLGRQVQKGEILVEIEADGQRLALREVEARRQAVRDQLAARWVEFAAQQDTLERERQSSAAGIEQSRADTREAEALRDLAAQDATRQVRLAEAGLTPARERDRATADARSRTANVESLTLATTRLQREQLQIESQRKTTIQQLRVELTRLQGELSALAETADRQAYEIERRRIRAPAAGRLGDVTVLQSGSFLDEGQTVAVLVPGGRLRIVAEFAPAAALGRIRPGQKAWMRLDGFPWTQYGAVAATVEHAGGEVRDGRVRVELRVNDPASVPVALQHGLPGTVEVQVETVTPAVLVLRTAGQLVTRPEKQYQ
jgi:membrane fusion protein (multidrug efflux system)